MKSSRSRPKLTPTRARLVVRKVMGLPFKRHGRRKPYTQAGIERLPCVRCGAPAHASWQACADNRLHRPICLRCDIALNELVLQWMGDPDWRAKMKVYKEKQA